MRSLVRSASLAIVIAASSAVLWSQTARPLQSPYLAPADNLVALRSSRMFDARAGTILNNQIILITTEPVPASVAATTPTTPGGEDQAGAGKKGGRGGPGLLDILVVGR